MSYLARPHAAISAGRRLWRAANTSGPMTFLPAPSS